MPTQRRSEPTDDADIRVDPPAEVNREQRREQAKSPEGKVKKRTATLADLKGKRARKGKAVLAMLDEDDELIELEIRLVALSHKDYDELQAQFPPTRKQRDRAFEAGQSPPSFDMDAFAPELIAACAVEPKISVDDMKEMWGSGQWSGGELISLFMECQRICQSGLDIPFNVAG